MKNLEKFIKDLNRIYSHWRTKVDVVMNEQATKDEFILKAVIEICQKELDSLRKNKNVL